MIIRTVQGRSFKGVGLYVLHDKGAQTADRVAFTETLNLPTDNARVAVAHMIDTATHANELKRRAGVKGNKPLSYPVYHYTLSWETSETPSQADQIEAARESLKVLGIEDRQALIVAHTDTDNPHVHVVVNRVCPDTGRAAQLGNDRIKLSNWAEAYRKARGQEHLCPNRAANNNRRAEGEWVKDTKSLTRQEWMAWKRAQTGKEWEEYRKDRDQARDGRKGLYDALWRQKQERIALRRDEIKQSYKPIWRDTFKRQRKELADFDAGLFTRIKFALSQKDGRALGVVRAVIDKADLRRDFIGQQEEERLKIGQGQRSRIEDASRETTKAWRHDRDQLKAMHQDEDKRRLEATKTRTDNMWKDGSSPPREDFTEEAQPQKRARTSARDILGEKRTRSRTRRPRR